MSSLFQRHFDGGDYILECLIDVRPLRDWTPIFWRRQELSERQIVPVAWSQDDRDYPCIASLVFFESPLHFAFVAVIGSDEIWAHKQEDDICCIDVLVNCVSEILARDDTAVMP